MKKSFLPILLSFFLLLSLTSCKLEFPDQVAENSSASAAFTQDGSSKTTQNPPDDSTKSTGNSDDVTKSSDNQASLNNSEAKSAGAAVSSSTKQNTETGKDKYQTDPIPDGKPAPVEPQDQTANGKEKLTATLSITCKTILSNMDKFNKDKLSVLPDNGVIYSERQIVFCEGESVFDILLRETKKNRIHMEFEDTPIYNSAYIEGIHNIYEFDCGDLSGWMYKVNGWFPNYGCSRYQLKAGDKIEWVYTCDLGRDVGCDWLADTN